MSSFKRRERAAEMIEQALTVLLTQAADERLNLINITAVEVNQDLSAAKVWMTVSGDEEERREALTALKHAQGFIRSEIAQALDLRRAPTLTYYYDESVARAERVMEIFKQLEEEKNGEAVEAGADERRDA